jgi:hypothetical protein
MRDVDCYCPYCNRWLLSFAGKVFAQVHSTCTVIECPVCDIRLRIVTEKWCSICNSKRVECLSISSAKLRRRNKMRTVDSVSSE